MKRQFLLALMLLTATVLMLLIGHGAITKPANTPNVSLRSLADTRGIGMGTAVAMQPLRNDPAYREVVAREFNTIVAENAMKFQAVHPERDRFDFTDADELVAFAKANKMQVRGHTFVWFKSLPTWLTKGKFSREQLQEILREHIQTVVGRYRGQLAVWDVVNEAVEKDGSLRKTIWLKKIGPEHIEMAFRWAHEADPQALLFYNDFSGEGLGKKSDAIYTLVRDLQKRGVPIHGVGLQMHIGIKSSLKPQDVAANIKRLAALGLEVHITEMDVKIQDGTGTKQERFAAQAQVYRDMLSVCLSVPKCKAFVMWGFTDRHTWIPGFTHKPDEPLIFDKSYRPKPAYYALTSALEK
ncbi:endo-1,4-beta-xylanase [Coleofasciculus sp. H7-2]|uniref:endo-1,4-beta-xylanase n=1 Tax=Coleofasciculus sp. H7-2 TaxID=3351545 RepID=UPI00366C1FF5